MTFGVRRPQSPLSIARAAARAAIVLLTLCRFSGDPGCPQEARGIAPFQIVDETSRPIGNATLAFTASNWDSTIIQVSDDEGGVTVLCVPPGRGYDVRVTKHGYATTAVSVDVGVDSPVTRVTLKREPGRYVRAMMREGDVPGVRVEIEDPDGTRQVLTTDDEVIARFAPLRAKGDAVFTLSLDGLETERAHVIPDRKNGPLFIEMQMAVACHDYSVVR